MITPEETLGALRAWCQKERGNQLKLSQALGVPEGSVSRWVNGSRVPDGKTLTWIDEFLLGHLPAETWLQHKTAKRNRLERELAELKAEIARLDAQRP